jgi:hypothetical protein
MMTLENRSPGVVSVSGGAIQNFPVPTGEVVPGGSYTTVRTLTGIMRGSFNISAFVREEPLDRFDARQAVTRTLQQWQTSNGIRIEPDAQVLIQRSVRAAKNDLDSLLDTHSSESDYQKLLTNLVRSYCFQLRDFKRGVLTASLSPTFFAFRNLPFANAFQSSALAVQSITKTDVTEHSFLSFLQNLLSSLTGTEQLSSLEVCSVPDAANIIIDGRRVGATTANFVVSAGQHRVVIDVPGMACSLTAKAGQDSSVSCPKKARCQAPGHDR